ncbi:GUN4 protein [Rivularia sp. PCC 7116]|uniref:AAA-like domain-containing protein n=1 Tax=Rivularia sp. PCC 7116 TaxID=373994 RepID=UPI00029EFD18|nr:AAA-like domain-containing protein [Rivularia sp. PCC 7116]AFY59169.1 GUN4 protein [Rivularia sp. PCC 7116]
MTTSNSNFYQIGASLPVDAPSYVQRQADEKFYQKLKAGKFCYVLNSRQMGKSSLRVQTMQRLQKQGTVCAAIDLTGIGKVSQEQWYGGIVYNLSESCQLEDKFDFDWQEWWQQHQAVLSPVQCLSLFIQKVLLDKIQQPIVIFVDEIDKVLSQDFSADDFFALIRFFQNQRVDNPIFQRLTFALLGVATPSDLITDKTQTPFNIGEAIELNGFQTDEVEPLIKGLEGKFNYPQRVIEEILHWTGGQPFLTQKLCKFMVEESEKNNPNSVKEVVKSRIIENWESQDDPEHLRTIRDRILSSEQRAGYLLELYKQIQLHGEIAAKKNVESSELRLSGLVVQRQNKLRVYNRVYQQVFSHNWVEVQLKNLRPYSEAFRAWVASGCTDKSRLLRGKALESAEKWAKDKDLSFQDKQFLAASREKEIAFSNKKAEYKRAEEDRRATEDRNKILSEANKKAVEDRDKILSEAQRFRISSIIAFSVAAISLFFTIILATQTHTYIKTVEELTKLAGELENEGSDSEAKELFSLAGQSVNIKDRKLKLAILNTGISYAYQKFENKDLKKAENYLKKIENISKARCDISKIKKYDAESQFCILFLKVSGNFFKENNKSEKAIEQYKSAFDILSDLKQKRKRGKTLVKVSPVFISQSKVNIISKQKIEDLHLELIRLISENNDKNSDGYETIKTQTKDSLGEYYLDELNNLLLNKKWQEADKRTHMLMLYIADKEIFLDTESIKTFSCESLRYINSLWEFHSKQHFGLSIQKKIWIDTRNRLAIKTWKNRDEENFIAFVTSIGWYEKEKENYFAYNQLVKKVEEDYQKTSAGIMPTLGFYSWVVDESGKMEKVKKDYLYFKRDRSFLFERLDKCNL